MNYVNSYTDDNNDLYLKFFLLDDSLNARGWSVDPSVIPKLARNAVGKPFTDYEDFTSTLFGDHHPWSEKKGATIGDHISYAMQKATGIIVDFSPVSQNALKSAAGQEIQQRNGYYVTVKVTDPQKRELYKSNPKRIPKVSPGIIDWDNNPADKATGLRNVDIVHLAGVPQGAYGEKARLYATCSGGYECVNHLKSASNTAEIDWKNTEFTVSSLGKFPDNSNSNIMSTQDTKEQTPTSQPVVETKESQNQNNTNNTNPVTTGSPLVRLKTESPTPAVIKEKVDFKQDPEYQKLLKEHEELKTKIELEEQKKSYFEVIPRELFILNGKFDSQGYNKEIEKAVEKKLDTEYAKELYTLKLKNVQMNSKLGTGKPYGASTSQKSNPQSYQTPSDVPESSVSSGGSELKGASSNGACSSQFNAIKNICRMFNLTSSGGDF